MTPFVSMHNHTLDLSRVLDLNVLKWSRLHTICINHKLFCEAHHNAWNLLYFVPLYMWTLFMITADTLNLVLDSVHYNFRTELIQLIDSSPPPRRIDVSVNQVSMGSDNGLSPNPKPLPEPMLGYNQLNP